MNFSTSSTSDCSHLFFRESVSVDLLDEIAALKARIEREIVGLEDLHRNVKLGYGGIREIEFILQTLQLLHGAKNAFLQERNSLKTLAALEQLQILPPHEVRLLSDAYIFLRAVEHRLQIQNEQQTHTLPVHREAWIGIARTLGYDRGRCICRSVARAHLCGAFSFRSAFEKQ